MKKFSYLILLLCIFESCSNESVDELAYNILDDKNVPLVQFFDPSVDGNVGSVGFTSIYDQLTPEAQAAITHYNVYYDEENFYTSPLTTTRVSKSGLSGSVVCLAIAFASPEGESRRSSSYCLSIP